MEVKDTYGRGAIKLFRWVNGRQGSGYKIMYLWNWKFDLVFIRYPVESYIDWHVDPVPKGLEHHRVNIILRKAEGGEFMVMGNWEGVKAPMTQPKRRVIYFRPDIVTHSVSKVTKGERWVLSIGWVRKVK